MVFTIEPILGKNSATFLKLVLVLVLADFLNIWLLFGAWCLVLASCHGSGGQEEDRSLGRWLVRRYSGWWEVRSILA